MRQTQTAVYASVDRGPPAQRKSPSGSRALLEGSLQCIKRRLGVANERVNFPQVLRTELNAIDQLARQWLRLARLVVPDECFPDFCCGFHITTSEPGPSLQANGGVLRFAGAKVGLPKIAMLRD